MKIFVLISEKKCFIFERETKELAEEYANQEFESYELTEIEGINIQHEILFELAKTFRELVNDEAEKNGINPKANPNGINN